MAVVHVFYSGCPVRQDRRTQNQLFCAHPRPTEYSCLTTALSDGLFDHGNLCRCQDKQGIDNGIDAALGGGDVGALLVNAGFFFGEQGLPVVAIAQRNVGLEAFGHLGLKGFEIGQVPPLA